MRQYLWVACGLIISACGAAPPVLDGGASHDGDAGAVIDAGGDIDAGTEVDAGEVDAGAALDAGDDAGSTDAGPVDAGSTDAGRVDAGLADAGRVDAGFPAVDRTTPRRHETSFTAAQADPDAGAALGLEYGVLDTRVAPRGVLVVHLHGAGLPTTCGSVEHGRLLASWGFHVFSPCYVSDYGVGNCGADIAACRMEAFDGVDRTSVISISRADSIEARVIRGLQRLATVDPQGDWGWYVPGGRLRYDFIIFSGSSHGASTAGLLSKRLSLRGAVMLSGPLDTAQAWLAEPTTTPVSTVFGFTHTGDPQHSGHLAAFATMGLPGMPVNTADAGVLLGPSHRFVTSAATTNPHSSTEANSASPRDGGYLFEPIWRRMYGVP